MQNGSKYVPSHLRNWCNGVPSVNVDNNKKSRVISFGPKYVPSHLRNRVIQNAKHVPRNPVRQIDCEYVPPYLRNRLHGVPSEKKYKKTIEVTDDHANLDADQGFAPMYDWRRKVCRGGIYISFLKRDSLNSYTILKCR